MTAAEALSSNQPSLSSQIARLAKVLDSAPTGDLAALRRWAPGNPIPMAFYRLWLRHANDDLPPEKLTEVWMAIVWAIATLGSKSHDPARPFGQALAESKFSEGRLERLLSAPEDVRIDLFMSAMRFLAAKEARFNLVEAAQFLLTTDADKREALHRRIASAFFRYLETKE